MTKENGDKAANRVLVTTAFHSSPVLSPSLSSLLFIRLGLTALPALFTPFLSSPSGMSGSEATEGSERLATGHRTRAK